MIQQTIQITEDSLLGLLQAAYERGNVGYLDLAQAVVSGILDEWREANPQQGTVTSSIPTCGPYIACGAAFSGLPLNSGDFSTWVPPQWALQAGQ